MQQTIQSAAAATLPYIRIDRYSDVVCNTVANATVTTYNTLSGYAKQLQLPPVPPVITELYQQGKDGVGKFITTTPYINTIAKNVIDKYDSIPKSSPGEFCDWVNTHATTASSNMVYLVQHPQVITKIEPKTFFTQEPTKLMATHSPLLTNTTKLNYLHILHTFATYVVGFILFITVLNIIHSILSILLGKKGQAKIRDLSSLYLYGIEIFELADMKPEWGITAESWYQKHIHSFHQSEENAQFVRRVHLNSGLATEEPTHLSPEITADDPQQTIVKSREESHMYIVNLLTKIFSKYNLKPTDIDVLVINCSLFNPTPSHCAMAINHFKMRDDIISYAIHGMGCSASAIAVNCCRDALQCHPKKSPVGVVISFENLTLNFYHGKERGMLVSNALFRLGAAAMVLGRDQTIRVPRGPTLSALYRLDHLVRTHIGASDDAYRCIWQEEDNDGVKGVRLSKDVPKIAGRALTKNVTRLAKLILPYHELIRYGIKMVICKLLGKNPGSPNFLTAVDHVCVHAGGRGVIDAIENDFKFPPHITKPSREVLYKFGNQSSASIWYIFKHIHPNVKHGQKVWQMTFGSGFKANSLVWTRL